MELAGILSHMKPGEKIEPSTGQGCRMDLHYMIPEG